METEAERRARIQGNLQRLKAAGASPERIQQYVDSERVTPEMEAAREPLGVGGNVRGVIANLGEGVGFSLADEVMGGLRGAIDPRITAGEGVDEVRGERDRFAQAHPKTALGLTLGGAVLPAVLTAGAASGAAPSALRVAGTGAATGAIAGYGSGEGGALSTNRLGRGTAGGVAGGLLGAIAPKVLTTQGGLAGPGGQVTDDLLARLTPAATSAGASTTARGVPTQEVMPSGGPKSPVGFGTPAFKAAGRALPDRAKARTLLDELEAAGMGDEALAMNVGDDHTVRAVRAAANLPGSKAGQTVNERLARQGGALGEQVPRDIGRATGFGTEFPEVIADDMQRELGAKVKAGYDAFRALPEVPLDPTDEAQRLFIERYVDPVIRNRRLTGNLSGGSALSGETVDAAFKNLQRELRGGQTAVGMGSKGVSEVQQLEAMRDRVLAAISAVDPNYAQLGRTYALDEGAGKVVQESFEAGGKIRTPGAATVAMRGASAPEQRALRLGNVAGMQSAARRGASNVDLGDLAQFRDVARAAVGTAEARETFKALHGAEQYDALLATLMPKVKAAAKNAAARGNSNSAKQFLDALAFGDDAALDSVGSLLMGSPQGAVRGMLGKVVAPADRAMRLGVGRTAGETADLLTTKGAPQIRTLLDYLDQLAAQDAARGAAVQPFTGALTRTAVGQSGGSRP